jgi:hypothetical protein
MIKLASLIGTIIIGATLLFFFYTGMFDRIELSRESRGPYNLVYREYQGPRSGVRYVMNTVYRYVRDTLHLESGTGFVIFYDDPLSGIEKGSRCICGVVVDSCPEVAVPYKTGVFRRTEAVVGSVKLRSFFSYTIGGSRFYYRLTKLLAEKNETRTGPVLELYEMKQKRIQYVAPLDGAVAPAPAFSGK